MVTIKYKIGYTDDIGHHYTTTWWGTEDKQEAVESFEKWTFYTVDEIERIDTNDSFRKI